MHVHTVLPNTFTDHEIKKKLKVLLQGEPMLEIFKNQETVHPSPKRIIWTSIDCGDLPEDWVNANISKVRKKGDVH